MKTKFKMMKTPRMGFKIPKYKHLENYKHLLKFASFAIKFPTSRFIKSYKIDVNREYKITFPTSKFKHRYLIVFTEEDKFNMMTTPRMGFKILKVKYIFALLH